MKRSGTNILKYKNMLIILILLLLEVNSIECIGKEYLNDKIQNKILFEKTDYGLIFTMIR